jgi:hypothetical protein
MLRVTFLIDGLVHASRSYAEVPQVGDEVEMDGVPNFPSICRVVKRRWKIPYDMTSVDVTLERVDDIAKKKEEKKDERVQKPGGKPRGVHRRQV